MLLTRAPLRPLRRETFVRLACVRHAASVRSEPGSNSQVRYDTTAEADASIDVVRVRGTNNPKCLPLETLDAQTRTVFALLPRVHPDETGPQSRPSKPPPAHPFSNNLDNVKEPDLEDNPTTEACASFEYRRNVWKIGGRDANDRAERTNNLASANEGVNHFFRPLPNRLPLPRKPRPALPY